MIISHKHQFIFIKTAKTAGTSVEIALSRLCGEDDIITPISPEDELKRQKAGGVSPQNYLVSPLRYTPSEWWKKLTRGKQPLRFYNHMAARKIRHRIGSDIWNRYYKFCIERNPWDRAISHYYWQYRHLKTSEMPSIEEFLESKHTRLLKRRGFELYTLKGEVAVDRICRYECLDEDLEEVRQHLKLPESLELPKAKSGIRKDKRHYRDVLSKAENDRIAELFRDEIELMGYEF